jgi:hypothetical protein
VTRRRAVLLAWALLGLFALVRAFMAGFGAIPAARAAGEIGALLGGALLVGIVIMAAPRALEGGRFVLTALLLIVTGAAFVFPLFRLAYPEPSVFTGNLGGARRQLASPPVEKTDTYVIEIGRPREASTDPDNGPYRVQVTTSQGPRTFAGKARGETPESFSLPLTAGERPVLLFELGGGWLGVRVGQPPLDWRWVRWACLVLALLATALDVAASTGRGRGLVAGAGATLALYAVQLDALTPPTGGQALGAGVVAVVAGAICAALAGGLVRALRKRR